MRTQKIFIELIFFVLLINLVAASPLLAVLDLRTQVSNVTDIFSEKTAILVGEIMHAWLSLTAAIIIFALTRKYMGGGLLARPMNFIGAGALVNALVGFIPTYFTLFKGGLSVDQELWLLWIGGSIFNIAVIGAVFWVAKVFGVFTFPRK